MSASVQLDGFDDLIRQLTDAPDEVRAEGMTIVRAHTEAARSELEAAYPKVTGTLAKRVKAVFPSSSVLVGIVMSTAPHAHLWHWGTKSRKTHTGANRGVMPKANPEPLVRIAQKHRLAMFSEMRELLRRKGFQVGG